MFIRTTKPFTSAIVFLPLGNILWWFCTRAFKYAFTTNTAVLVERESISRAKKHHSNIPYQWRSSVGWIVAFFGEIETCLAFLLPFPHSPREENVFRFPPEWVCCGKYVVIILTIIHSQTDKKNAASFFSPFLFSILFKAIFHEHSAANEQWIFDIE